MWLSYESQRRYATSMQKKAKSVKRVRFELYYLGPVEDLDSDELLVKSLRNSTPEIRLEATWDLVVAHWRMHHKEGDEPPFDRTTFIVKPVKY